jgi:hypothetical protein
MTLRYISFVLAFALVLTGGAPAADVAGKWKADFQTADHRSRPFESSRTSTSHVAGHHMIGTTLGQYRIERLLGSGGMSEVSRRRRQAWPAPRTRNTLPSSVAA